MEFLLDFIYSGEVMLKQEELENFLKTGEELGVKGLAISETPTNSTPPKNELNSDNVPSSELAKKFPTPEASSPVKIESLPILATNPPLKAEQTIMRGDKDFGTLVKSEECDSSFDKAPNNYQMDDWKDLKNYATVHKESPRAKAIYKCSLCEKIMNHSEAMIRHIESKHFRGAFTHTCPACQKTCETRAMLNWHQQREHKIKSDST